VTRRAGVFHYFGPFIYHSAALSPCHLVALCHCHALVPGLHSQVLAAEARARVHAWLAVLMSEKIWFLKRCVLFEQLTQAERLRLERRAVMRTFRRREIIYFPTEPGESVLVLARGRVKIKAVNPEGKETIFAFIDEGEVFGELA